MGLQAQTMSLFNLGHIVATPGVLEALTQDQIFAMLQRHSSGDWGVCCEEDAESNNEALRSDEGRIQSAYPIDPNKPCKGWGKNCVWVITEWDRSVTTLLLPEEY